MNINEFLKQLKEQSPPPWGAYSICLRRFGNPKKGYTVSAAVQVPLESGEFFYYPINEMQSTEAYLAEVKTAIPKPKRMAKGGGKNKGSGFEREICERLSLWISKNERKDLFCRTVGSGGQFTAAQNRGKEAGLAGDIRSQHPLAEQLCEKVVIECKFWADLEVINFLDKKGLLYEALLKVKAEGDITRRLWWLICKQNRKAALIFMPANAVSGNWNNVPDFHAVFNGSVLMYNLEQFLNTVTIEEFIGNDNLSNNKPA